MAKVSFTEKDRHSQGFLAKEYPTACLFGDKLNLLKPVDKASLLGASNSVEAFKALETFELNARCNCLRHGVLCSIHTSPDINIFGAPCVDDSSLGKQSMDEGISRKAGGFACVFADDLGVGCVCALARLLY